MRVARSEIDPLSQCLCGKLTGWVSALVPGLPLALCSGACVANLPPHVPLEIII